MADHDTYILKRLDDVASRFADVEKTQAERVIRNAEWKTELAAQISSIEDKLGVVEKWIEATEKRARQALYGVGAVALALISRAPKENIDGLTGILKALKGFLTALSCF